MIKTRHNNHLIKQIVAFISNGATIFFIAVFVGSIIQLYTFFQLTPLNNTFWRSTLLIISIDSLTIYLPYIFIPAKWRRTIWIPIVIFTLFLITNIWYARVFHNFYSGSIIRFGNIFNSFVIKGTISAMGIYDLAIIAPPLLIIPIYIYFRESILSTRYSNPLRLTAFILWILSPFLQIGFSCRRIAITQQNNYSTTNHSFYPLFKERILDSFIENQPGYLTYIAETNGIPYLFCYTIYNIFPRHIDISTQEHTEIHKLLCSKSNSKPLTNNSNKNLIFIVVESLNSSVLQLPYSLNITPNLHRLMTDSSIVTLKVIPQTGLGNSADGQFIYNTGLLPTRDVPFICDFASADYPSIAKTLNKHYSIELIGEDRAIWNHDLSTLSFGFDNIFDNLQSKPTDTEEQATDLSINADNRIFRWASKIVQQQPQPFFAFITTISSHSPYTNLSVTPSLDENNPFISNLPSEDRNYLEAIHHFDSALGNFINQLRLQNLLGNTIIVITADHSVPDGHISSLLDDSPIPLIIYNSGISLKYDSEINQIDVFPTILDIMGVETYILPQTGKPYRGLGRSIFNSTLDSIQIESAWNLSEKIILSRFFDYK